MRVLFVTADYPFAGRAGSFVYARTILEFLSEVADVTIASLELTPGRQGPASGIPSVFAPSSVLGAGKLASQLKSVFTKGSMVETKFNSALSLAWLVRQLENMQPNLVVFNHLRAAWLIPHLPPHWQRKSVYLAHNAEGAAYRSVAALQSNPIVRTLVNHGAGKIERLEDAVISAASATWCISAQDRQLLAGLGREIHVIPPVAVVAPVVGRPDTQRLLLVGSFNWQAKRQNATWLAQEVWPAVRARLPDWQLHIVGAGAARLGPRVLAERGVSIFADVESVDPFFQQGGIFVVPERQQGGVKLKTLEAAAWGLPIVSTPEGVEGTPLQNRSNCLVAGDAVAFVSAITRIAAETDLGRALGVAANASVAAAHSKGVVHACFRRALARWIGTA